MPAAVLSSVTLNPRRLLGGHVGQSAFPPLRNPPVLQGCDCLLVGAHGVAAFRALDEARARRRM
jgi:hypothetical protein